VQKSFSLIEVLISVMLLSVVITSLLQIRDNSLFFLDKFERSNLLDSYIAIASLHNKETNIYLDDIINIKDDELKKELKKIKIKIDINLEDTILLEDDEFPLEFHIKSPNYSNTKLGSKELYSISN